MRFNSAHEFLLYVDGKSMWGGECVQLFNGFMKEMYGSENQIFCTASGYAKDIWNQRKTNGVLKFFDEVPVNKMVDGDWVIYDNCKYAQHSHIGMFRKDNGNGTFVCLQQNDYRHPKSTAQDNNTYDGIMGALRLKDWHKEEKENNIKYLNLNPEADTWRVYPMNVVPTVGNECKTLYPSKFNGLSYTIKGYTQSNVAIIETRDYGQVQIYIGQDVANMFSITDSPVYGLVK